MSCYVWMVAVWAGTVELSLVSTPGTRAQPMESSQLAATSWRGRHQTTENSRDNTKDNSRDNSLEYDLLPAPRAAAVPDPGGAGRALHQPQGGVLAGPVHHPATALCGKEAE